MNKKKLDLQNKEMLAEQVLHGEASFCDLYEHFDDRASALRFYSAKAIVLYSEKEIQGVCDFCNHNESIDQIIFTWQAIVNFQIKENILNTLFWFPIVLICKLLLPIYRLPIVDIQYQAINYSTYHNICKSCNKSYQIKSLFCGILSIILTIIFLLAILISIFGGIFCFVALFNLAGWGIGDLKNTLPFFLIPFFSAIFAKLAIRYLERLLIIPRSAKMLYRRPFKLEKVSRSGDAYIEEINHNEIASPNSDTAAAESE